MVAAPLCAFYETAVLQSVVQSRLVCSHASYIYACCAGSAAADSGTSADAQPAARFTSLPRQHTLTVRLDVPEPWNVQTARAVQDTDNLRCRCVPLCVVPLHVVSVSSSAPVFQTGKVEEHIRL
jgi:hypothetical protein